MKKQKILRYINCFGMPVTLILFGLILLMNPDSASILISRILGWVFTVVGVCCGISGLLDKDRRISRILGAVACLMLGGVLLGNPLLLARYIGRFLGILLAIEGANCLRKENGLFGGILLAAAAVMIFAPMTVSRLVFALCGLAVLVIGIAMLVSRVKERRYLPDGDDPNIIDAL